MLTPYRWAKIENVIRAWPLIDCLLPHKNTVVRPLLPVDVMLILLNGCILARLHRRGKPFVLVRPFIIVRFFNVIAHSKNTVVRPLLFCYCSIVRPLLFQPTQNG